MRGWLGRGQPLRGKNYYCFYWHIIDLSKRAQLAGKDLKEHNDSQFFIFTDLF